MDSTSGKPGSVYGSPMSVPGISLVNGVFEGYLKSWVGMAGDFGVPGGRVVVWAWVR
jgi:hypothetical protein